MSGKNIQENIDFLFKAISLIDSMEECEAFFDDMCTKTELASISQRLVVAKMLMEKCIYSDISAKTGASTATISRVNRSLAFGKGGYERIFAKMHIGCEGETQTDANNAENAENADNAEKIEKAEKE